MNYSDIIFYDFETGSVNPHRCQPIQIAAIPIHGRKAEVIPDIFQSYIRPIFDPDEARFYNLDPLEDSALEVNKITREQLESAPPIKVVWQQFQDFVNQYNYKKNKWTAPIKAGFNNTRFDDIILDRIAGGNNRHIRILNRHLLTDIKNVIAGLSDYEIKMAEVGDDLIFKYEKLVSLCRKIYSDNEPYKFGPWDEERGEETLFRPRDTIDLMRIVWNWTENMADIKQINMDAVRDWLGITKEGAHNAKVDVKQGAEILCRFMRITRKWANKTKWKS